MGVDATQARRSVARTILAALVAVGAAGCAKEPPTEAERMSLKDSWASGTTVTHADPQPVKTVYTPPPPPPALEVRPVPIVPKQAAPARPAPPTLALSPPKAEAPPPATKPVSPTPAPTPAKPISPPAQWTAVPASIASICCAP
jgi:hypothetical protein